MWPVGRLAVQGRGGGRAPHGCGLPCDCLVYRCRSVVVPPSLIALVHHVGEHMAIGAARRDLRHEQHFGKELVFGRRPDGLGWRGRPPPLRVADGAGLRGCGRPLLRAASLKTEGRDAPHVLHQREGRARVHAQGLRDAPESRLRARASSRVGHARSRPSCLLLAAPVQKETPEGKPTVSAHPARFSPDDKFSKHRIICKKRFGLLPMQQPKVPL